MNESLLLPKLLSLIFIIKKTIDFLNQGNNSSNYPGTEASPSDRNREPEAQISQYSIDASSRLNLVYAKTSPGSYCHHNYYQETNMGDWNPKPIIGVPIQRGKFKGITKNVSNH